MRRGLLFAEEAPMFLNSRSSVTTSWYTSQRRLPFVLRLLAALPHGLALGGPLAGGLRRAVRDRLDEPRLDGCAHACHEPGALLGERPGVCQGVDRLGGEHPPPGEPLGGVQCLVTDDAAAPRSPVVSHTEVRVGALKQRLQGAGVVPPRGVVQPVSYTHLTLPTIY